MSQLCQMNVEPFFQCCCNCEHHWPDYHHCTTKPTLRDKMDNKCICGVQKGWICVGMRVTQPGGSRVYSGWPKHSVGCEMYTPIKLVNEQSAASHADNSTKEA